MLLTHLPSSSQMGQLTFHHLSSMIFPARYFHLTSGILETRDPHLLRGFPKKYLWHLAEAKIHLSRPGSPGCGTVSSVDAQRNALEDEAPTEGCLRGHASTEVKIGHSHKPYIWRYATYGNVYNINGLWIYIYIYLYIYRLILCHIHNHIIIYAYTLRIMV